MLAVFLADCRAIAEVVDISAVSTIVLLRLMATATQAADAKQPTATEYTKLLELER